MVQTATAPTAVSENPTAIFDTAIALFIQSGERLLELFDKLSKPEQQANEVLKRSALVMTLTTWETFIESWLRTQMCQKLAALKGSFAGDYIQKKFTDAINRLHNPDAVKVRQLSLEFCSLMSPNIGCGITLINMKSVLN
ncbi:HEPN domain-containing protein [Rheinheimera texasensis]|uniref:HEPN domain-containing protein n=1 Tax=Rheinheimera texasensis TaxID=306205 RepID=UPI0032B2BB73